MSSGWWYRRHAMSRGRPAVARVPHAAVLESVLPVLEMNLAGVPGV